MRHEYEVVTPQSESVVIKAGGFMIDENMIIFFDDEACQKEPPVAAFAAGRWAYVIKHLEKTS